MDQSATSQRQERRLIDVAFVEARRLAPPRVALPPADSFPGYRLTRLIRRGAQGVVYEAVSDQTHERVAIKTLRAAAVSDHARARFEIEASLLRRLRHPHIVPILDSGESSIGMYLVMPLIEGGVLDPVAWSQRSLTQRLEMFITVCRAVQAAHVTGVIHRDLKPSNILFDSQDQPIIADFGLAKLDQSSLSSSHPWASLTMSGEFVGSLAWASPEQWSADPTTVDVRSDVYSLGVIGYQLVTGGRLPYGEIENIPEWIGRSSRMPPTRPRAHTPTLPRDVETILLKALQRSPEQRYQSAGDLARDLERFLAREPIEARRDSVWYVLSRWVARRRAMAAMTALTLTALIAAVVISSGALVRTQRAQRLESAAAMRAKAINDYLLNDMLTAASPDRDGRNTKVIDVLNRAADGVASAFASDYEIQAEINETIGESYLNLGAYELAEDVFKAAQAAIAQSDLERPDAAVSVSNRIAKLRWLQGRHGQALELFRLSYEQAVRSLGLEHEGTVEAMTGLAVLLRLAGELDEARVMCEAALDVRRKQEGLDGPETLTLLNNLAFIERAAGNLSKAETYMKQVVASANRALGAENPTTLITRVNLASILIEQNKLDEAEQHLALALAGQTNVLGVDHPETSAVRMTLAQLHLSQGRSAEAQADLLEALRVLPAEAHMSRARSLTLLAKAHLAQSQPRQSATALGQAHVELSSLGSTGDTSDLRAQLAKIQDQLRAEAPTSQPN